MTAKVNQRWRKVGWGAGAHATEATMRVLMQKRLVRILA
jgi:hypothetical protein